MSVPDNKDVLHTCLTFLSNLNKQPGPNGHCRRANMIFISSRQQDHFFPLEGIYTDETLSGLYNTVYHMTHNTKHDQLIISLIAEMNTFYTALYVR